MFRGIISQFTRAAVLSFSLTSVVTAQDSHWDEVELALAAVGKGAAEEMKSRLLSKCITVLDDAFRAHAVAALPDPIHSQRITQGKLLRRVDAIFNQVLQLQERNGKVELFLFRDDRPSAKLWQGCVVAISDGLAEPLYDGELAGVLAHELGHSYFEDEMAAAWRTRDTRAMRVVELKCDGIAILSLKLLGHDTASYLRGVGRLRMIAIRKGLSDSVFPSHPDLVERAKFSQRFIKSMR